MFELMVETTFSAANALPQYQNRPGKRRYDGLHGHNFVVRLYAQVVQLNAANIGIDFTVLKEHLVKACKHLEHQDMSQLPQFQGEPTSNERVAQYLYEQIKPTVPALTKIVLYETPIEAVTYQERSPVKSSQELHQQYCESTVCQERVLPKKELIHA